MLRNFSKFRGKHLCQVSFIIKSLKKKLLHSCFPLNFQKFLRTSFFIEHFWNACVCCTWYANVRVCITGRGKKYYFLDNFAYLLNGSSSFFQSGAIALRNNFLIVLYLQLVFLLECKNGYIKKDPGNRPCKLCGKNSAQYGGNRLLCPCLSGFFRVPKETADENDCYGANLLISLFLFAYVNFYKKKQN